MIDKGRSFVARLKEHELASRVGSATALALLALGVTAWGGVLFALFWAAAAAFFFAEFLAMVAYRPLMIGAAIGATGLAAANMGAGANSPIASLAAMLVAAVAVIARGEAGARRFLGAAGLVYALCVAMPVVILRTMPERGFIVTIWLYVVVWATDIGAFFVGRTLGGSKLWSRISPKKTWSGLIGGSLIGVGAAMSIAWLSDSLPLQGSALLIASLAVSLATHAGDLLESALKRGYRIKDSSQLIPGHGGFMDRLDGFALASVIALTALRMAA